MAKDAHRTVVSAEILKHQLFLDLAAGIESFALVEGKKFRLERSGQGGMDSGARSRVVGCRFGDAHLSGAFLGKKTPLTPGISRSVRAGGPAEAWVGSAHAILPSALPMTSRQAASRSGAVA